MTSVCPKLSSRAVAVFFASLSLPEMNVECPPSASWAGSTIRAAVIVLRALTTLASGKVR